MPKSRLWAGHRAAGSTQRCVSQHTGRQAQAAGCAPTVLVQPGGRALQVGRGLNLRTLLPKEATAAKKGKGPMWWRHAMWVHFMWVHSMG